MNKIFNINLGGYPFTIDDDAYQQLDAYLSAINKHFTHSEGCEDIIADIEVRIAELFNEHLKGQPIVSKREVEKVIAIMGTPQEFGAEEAEPAQSNTKQKSKKAKFTKTTTEGQTTRRLFRDPDEKVVGGVCSGLSAYLGINDPVWLRLLFALMIFAGIGPLFYIILWIAIPEAKTAGDKLSMHGEKIDVSSIARKVEEEINHLADTISEMTKDFKTKKKA